METTKKMDNSFGYLLIGGFFAVFMNWIRGDYTWVLSGVWKGLMSLFYGGVGAMGAYFTRKYIITHIEKHKGFDKWMKYSWRRFIVRMKRGRGDGDTPKQ